MKTPLLLVMLAGCASGLDARPAGMPSLREMEAQRAADDAKEKEEAAKKAKEEAAKSDEWNAKVKSLPSASVTLVNDRDESIILLLEHFQDSSRPFGVALERMAAHKTEHLAGVLHGNPGEHVQIDIRAKSNGEERLVGVEEVEFRPGGELRVVYDWDAAMAKPRAVARWVDGG